MLDEILIATDDDRIREAAGGIWSKGRHDLSGSPVWHRPHRGSRRPASGLTHVFNIQGDEPLLQPDLVDSLARMLIATPDLAMITARTRSAMRVRWTIRIL